MLLLCITENINTIIKIIPHFGWKNNLFGMFALKMLSNICVKYNLNSQIDDVLIYQIVFESLNTVGDLKVKEFVVIDLSQIVYFSTHINVFFFLVQLTI